MSDGTRDRVVALVLAAGSGRRFGGAKQLAELHGRPLVAHVVAAASAAGLTVTAVVPDDEDVRAAARAAGAGTVVNPDPEAGMSASLVLGLSGLPAGVAAAVVLLADQPTVAPSAIRTVVAAWEAAPDVPWRARYDDGPGHPVVLPLAVREAVRTLRGDVGARDLLRPLGAQEVRIAGPRPPDVDVAADLEALRDAGEG